MADNKSQLALREWRRDLNNPVTWVALCGVAAVLTLVGPFDTDRSLALAQRAVYWAAMVSLTYSAGVLVNALARAWLEDRPVAVVFGLSGLGTGLAVCAIVLVANWLVFAYVPGPGDALPFFGTVIAITMIINAVLFYVGMRLAAQDTPAPPETRVPLLDRLPLDKRGALVAISVEDHYVRIQTVKGEEMVLMRLSDAIKEVGPVAGAQVHRSHWVAFGQVTAAQRRGDRAILTLSTGAELPVSRANLAKIKEAGLLPK